LNTIYKIVTTFTLEVLHEKQEEGEGEEARRRRRG
jgi:hypothetical protein